MKLIINSSKSTERVTRLTIIAETAVEELEMTARIRAAKQNGGSLAIVLANFRLAEAEEDD